jgi:hypothetical protein
MGKDLSKSRGVRVEAKRKAGCSVLSPTDEYLVGFEKRKVG